MRNGNRCNKKSKLTVGITELDARRNNRCNQQLNH